MPTVTARQPSCVVNPARRCAGPPYSQLRRHLATATYWHPLFALMLSRVDSIVASTGIFRARERKLSVLLGHHSRQLLSSSYDTAGA